MKERRKQGDRLFTSDFFAAIRAFYGSENSRVRAKAKAKLEKVAAIINSSAELEKAGGFKVVKEIQGIYIAKGENARLLQEFSKNFVLIADEHSFPYPKML